MNEHLKKVVARDGTSNNLAKPSNPIVHCGVGKALTTNVTHIITPRIPYCHNLDFLDRSCYFFFQIAPELYSLLIRKFDSAGNRTWTSGFVARNSDH
jgi:hypothetical protein